MLVSDEVKRETEEKLARAEKADVIMKEISASSRVVEEMSKRVQEMLTELVEM